MPIVAEKLKRASTVVRGSSDPTANGPVVPPGPATSVEPRSVARSNVSVIRSPCETAASPKSASAPFTATSAGGSARPASPDSTGDAPLSAADVDAAFFTSRSRKLAVQFELGSARPSARKPGGGSHVVSSTVTRNVESSAHAPE